MRDVYLGLQFKLDDFTLKLRMFYRKILRDQKVQVGKDVHMKRSSDLQAKVLIGDYTHIWGAITIKGHQKAIIKKYCTIGDKVTIITSNHKICHSNMQGFPQFWGFCSIIDIPEKPVTIGNAVWIGDRAIILPRVTIGSGAVIGAGSIVTKDVPAFAVVAGVPAKVLRMRFEETVIDKLLELAWWNWSEDKIKRNKRFFETDLTKVSVAQISKTVIN